jgi:hypothetical protein
VSLTLDLHPLFRNDSAIDRAVRETLFRAAGTGEDSVVIIYGRGSGKLQARVLALLTQRHLQRLHHGAELDPVNPGRVLVRMRNRDDHPDRKS